MVSMSGGGLSNRNSNYRPFENGYCSSSSVPIKYKRRRVSAIRDFPRGCGPNTPLINLMPQENSVVKDEKTLVAGDKENLLVGDDKNLVVGGEKATLNVEIDCVKATEVGVESLSREMVKSPVKLETSECLDDLVSKVVTAVNMEDDGRVVFANLEPLRIEMELPKALDDNYEQEFSKESHGLEVDASLKSEESIDVPENKTLLEICDPSIRLVPVVSPKSRSSPKWPISDNDLDETAPKNNKFTRRRVSAIRDFPPFCGRNARHPTAEERLKVVSKNRSLGGTEKTVNGFVGEPERDVPERDVRNGKAHKNVLKGHVAEQREKAETVIEKETEDVVRGSWRKVGKEIVLYSHGKSLERSPLDGTVDVDSEVDRVIVQGLMAAPNCPWSLNGGTSGSKAKKCDLSMHKKSKLVVRTTNEADSSKGKSKKRKSMSAGKELYGGNELILKDEEDPVGSTRRDFDITLPPFGPNSSSLGDARNKVRETLRLFQAICRKILQGEEAKSRKGELTKSKPQEKPVKRIDLAAAKIVIEKGKEVNTEKQMLGAVPGVEVGDEFQYRVELALVGVHRLYQGGIDWMKVGKDIVAASIVASGGYADDLDSADVLIYSGQGGTAAGRDKQPEDQKLERGNLALKNSISAENPVRVVRGSKETKASESSDTRAKIATTYVYDGLYTVKRYWQEPGQHGKLVFKFELWRIPGQPELAWKEVKKSTKFKVREGLCVDDISGGKELFPICAVNTIDNEKPPEFTYMTKMMYPDWFHPIPPPSCACRGGCSDSQKCSCVLMNGGEIPYNHNGAIVEVKPLVYECGPCCKCPPSCYNRVTQNGIKIQLEIFKTESRGWGVRSLTSITSGTFICEYVGELLEDKEAEKRTSNDEYLFDIGQNYNDCSAPVGSPPLKHDEGAEDSGYTIDAAEHGNVGRFINHSCSPNLYAQNVLYDHDDRRMPHIMLFAAENIPPLKELTYHYNYSVDQIRDSNGDVKMKSCYCGSVECTGRMY